MPPVCFGEMHPQRSNLPWLQSDKSKASRLPWGDTLTGIPPFSKQSWQSLKVQATRLQPSDAQITLLRSKPRTRHSGRERDIFPHLQYSLCGLARSCELSEPVCSAEAALWPWMICAGLHKWRRRLGPFDRPFVLFPFTCMI